jgi:hypothetical protein
MYSTDGDSNLYLSLVYIKMFQSLTLYIGMLLINELEGIGDEIVVAFNTTQPRFARRLLKK